MNAKYWIGLAVVSASLSPQVGQAAQVTFSVAAFDDVSQVSTSGTLVEAWNLGAGSDGDDVVTDGANMPGDVTINGVTFVSDDTSDVFFLDANANDWRRPNYLNPGGPSAAVNGLSDTDGFAFFHSYERNQVDGRGAVDGLTVGASYEIQLFLDRNCPSCLHSVGYSQNPGDVTPPLGFASFSALEPVVITGTFVADNAVQEIFLYEDNLAAGTGLGVGEISGFQLRQLAIPEPTTLGILVSSLAGLAFKRRRSS